MGSIELYDYKKTTVGTLQYGTRGAIKWDGYFEPDHRVRNFVGTYRKNTHRLEMKLLSPVVQACEIAKSERNRKKKRCKNDEGQKTLEFLSNTVAIEKSRIVYEEDLSLYIQWFNKIIIKKIWLC